MSKDQKTIIAHVDSAQKRDSLPEFSQDGKCPECGGVTKVCYGLAGGGIGVYSYCSACGIITSKSEDRERA